MRLIAVLWLVFGWFVVGSLVGGCTRVPAGLHVRATWGGVAPRWTTTEPRAIAFSADGKLAVLVAEQAELVAVPSGRVLATMPYEYVGYSDSTIAFAADSQHFSVVDARRGCVGVWTVAPPREMACLPADSGAAVAFSPDGAAIAVGSLGRVSRYSVATAARTWSVAVAQHANLWEAFAWPAPDAIVCDGAAPYSLARLDAADGHVAWTAPLEIVRVLGVYGGALVIHLHQAIARVSLATGATTEQPVESGDAIALLADGTVILQDFLGIVHRYRLGGGELGSFVVPRHTRLAARADGRFGVLLAATGLQTIDPLAGAPLELGDEQTAPIRALDASASSVISVGEDGSIVERRPDGALVKRMQATSRHCIATAASAAAREVLCAADIEGVVGLAGREPPTHEWLSLADSRARAIDWFGAGVVALDARAAWVGTQGQAMFVDPAARTPMPDPVPRWLPPTRAISQTVNAARIVEDGRAVIFGGAGYDGPFESYTGRGWYGAGLWRMARAGAPAALDEQAAVVSLGANRAEDALAVGELGGVSLWRLAGGRWRKWWTSGATAPGVGAVAASDDATLVASVESGGVVIVLRDGATGAHVAAISVGDAEITALAFGPGARLYAGTRDGRVLALTAARP